MGKSHWCGEDGITRSVTIFVDVRDIPLGQADPPPFRSVASMSATPVRFSLPSGAVLLRESEAVAWSPRSPMALRSTAQSTFRH